MIYIYTYRYDLLICHVQDGSVNVLDRLQCPAAKHPGRSGRCALGCWKLVKPWEKWGVTLGYTNIDVKNPWVSPRNFHIYVSWTNHWIGLRENLNRKPWFVPWNMGVSCKISLKPIRWIKKKDKTWRKLGEKCGLNSSSKKIAPVFFTVSRMG
jgi:hypothetical protein